MSTSSALQGLTPPARRGRSDRLLGQVVVDLGFASHEQVEHALGRARAERKLVGLALVEDGVVTPDQLARAIAERFGLDHVNLSEFPIDPNATALLAPQVAKRYGALPIGRGEDGRLLVAMSDPANIVALDDIGMLTGQDIRPAIAAPQDIELLVGRLDRLGDAVADAGVQDAEEEAAALAEVAAEMAVANEEDAPVVKLVNSIIGQAVEQGASDIHFTPHEGEMRVQYRVDGVLGQGVSVPRRLRQGVVTRVKIMAELDIAERRVPQDGRIGLRLEGRSIDVRVVTLPLVDGESIVMRILERDATQIGLLELGMGGDELERFKRAFTQSHGAVLVTGPTGSGKTTSLYAAMHELNNDERSIVTIEDPVEYRLDGLRQMQINTKAGVTFAKGLRSMMRADPDVVMVGEIRDRETAQIAIEAALTGHLVLSTLHTNDAATAVSRLIEMGVEPFLVASAIDCVVAQRLARQVCMHCRVEQTYPAETLRASGFAVDGDVVGYEAHGCGRCANTGYRGRVGLYEVMTVSEEIRALALARETAATIGRVAIEQGMRRLRDDGFEKVRAGMTTLAEVARVTGS